MYKYVRRIHVHGCLKVMDSVLEVFLLLLLNLLPHSHPFQNHVTPILTVFSIVGSVLAMVELLGVVLAFALARVIRQENNRKKVRRTKFIFCLKLCKNDFSCLCIPG